NDAIIKGMALEPQDRPQTVRKWLELLNPKSHPRQQIQEIQNLKSSKMDYTRLRDLLAAGEWKEANQETDRVMLAVAGREKERWFDYESIDSFPCEDLRIIDQL
ncbi:MAG: GUN4 domain-containing protein, partial [Nostoc sp.]